MLNSQPSWRAFLPYLSKLELFIVVQVRLLEAGSGHLARVVRGQSEGERAGLLGGAEDGTGTDEVGDGGELVITHHTVRDRALQHNTGVKSGDHQARPKLGLKT